MSNPPPPIPKAVARGVRLSALFLMCLAITRATTDAANQQNLAQNILVYEDGKPYNYCEASYPTVDNYPAPSVKGATLTNVQLFIRHGDRYTFHNSTLIANQVVTIPQDSPYASSIWKGSCIPGQLTPKGADQQQRLGKSLRGIYIDGKWGFLPDVLEQEKIFVRSTDFWRTRQSATNLMTGLYGTSNTPPPQIQLTTLPFDLEYLVINERGQCPRANQLKAKIAKESPVLQKLYKSYAKPIQDASKIIDPPNTLSIDQVHDFVLPRVCHQLPMPCVKGEASEGGEKCVDGKSVTDELAIFRSIDTAEMLRDSPLSKELLKVGFGPAVAMVRKNIVQAKERVKKQAMFSLYSGHDTMLMPLLGVLDSLDMRWPPYLSNLLIELWETPSTESYIRVIYNSRIVTTKTNWCDLSWCPLQTFIDHLEEFLPGDDYLEKCQGEPEVASGCASAPYESNVR
ncbi:Acid phosphatase-like protein 2 [Linnemannia zychae]|nr:Acid phosphatase-like protein 2 [Linnemannia zychae]